MTFIEIFDKYLSSGGLNYTKINGATIYLADGTKFYIGSTSSGLSGGFCKGLYYDVNGDKKPNEIGRDQFMFYLCSFPEYANCNTCISGFSTYLYKNSDRDYLLKWCKEGNSNEKGYFCTPLIALDGWEFKNDYPLKL